MPNTWTNHLQSVHQFAWQVLDAAANSKQIEQGLVTLATIGPNGPEARAVVMRQSDRSLATVAIYTDSATPKVDEINRDNRVAVMRWCARHSLQIRLTGTATVLTGKAVANTWDTLAPAQRENYGVTPVPGQAIPAHDAYERVAIPDRFAVILITVAQMDVVHLGQTPHVRAAFEQSDDWRGRWLAP